MLLSMRPGESAPRHPATCSGTSAPSCAAWPAHPRLSLCLRQDVDGTATRACPSCAYVSAASRVNPTCGDKPGHDEDGSESKSSETPSPHQPSSTKIAARCDCGRNA